MAATKLSRWDQIRDYAVRRLQAEVAAANRRGYQAELCRKIGISSAHMTNLVTAGTRGVGIDVASKLAAHWGMTLAELERVACGDAPEVAPIPTPVPAAPIAAEQLDELRQALARDMGQLLDERLRHRDPRERDRATTPIPKPIKKRSAPRQG